MNTDIISKRNRKVHAAARKDLGIMPPKGFAPFRKFVNFEFHAHGFDEKGQDRLVAGVFIENHAYPVALGRFVRGDDHAVIEIEMLWHDGSHFGHEGGFQLLRFIECGYFKPNSEDSGMGVTDSYWASSMHETEGYVFSDDPADIASELESLAKQLREGEQPVVCTIPVSKD